MTAYAVLIFEKEYIESYLRNQKEPFSALSNESDASTYFCRACNLTWDFTFFLCKGRVVKCEISL